MKAKIDLLQSVNAQQIQEISQLEGKFKQAFDNLAVTQGQKVQQTTETLILKIEYLERSISKSSEIVRVLTIHLGDSMHSIKNAKEENFGLRERLENDRLKYEHELELSREAKLALQDEIEHLHSTIDVCTQNEILIGLFRLIFILLKMQTMKEGSLDRALSSIDDKTIESQDNQIALMSSPQGESCYLLTRLIHISLPFAL
jgi:hypothetical protein